MIVAGVTISIMILSLLFESPKEESRLDGQRSPSTATSSRLALEHA